MVVMIMTIMRTIMMLTMMTMVVLTMPMSIKTVMMTFALIFQQS